MYQNREGKLKNSEFVHCYNVIFTNYIKVSSLVVASYPTLDWVLHGKTLYQSNTEEIKPTEERVAYTTHCMI